MTHPATHHPSRVYRKPRERGAASATIQLERRLAGLEGHYGTFGPGATLTGNTIQTSNNPTNYYPGIVYDSNGLRAYNSGGVVTMQINAADGSVTVNGTGVITGGTIQTSATPPRVIMDGSGLRGYNAIGTNTFNLSGADGSLTVAGGTITGGTIQTSSGSSSRVVMDAGGIRAYDSLGNNTVNIDTTGLLTVAKGSITLSSTIPAGTGARVTLDSGGIKGYNASNANMFTLDATSGLITATGVITANPGSSLPWQTPGFIPGGNNLVSNSSAEDPTNTTQTLYINTGAGTAGNFTLRYASNTISSSLSYNATAAQVQTALNAAGVLPAGITATCSGGPLPGTPIAITFAGVSNPAGASILTVPTNAVTGGTVVVGAQPVAWVRDSNSALDWVSLSTSFHGSNVLRLTTNGGGWSPASQTIGPMAPPPGSKWTLSAWAKAPTASRVVFLEVLWNSATGNGVGYLGANSSWNTAADKWQRTSVTDTVPPKYTTQVLTMTGSPTGGNFTLTYNGQTTAALPYNATAAQVKTALQALSTVGSTGIANNYGTISGGPFPGSPISIAFSLSSRGQGSAADPTGPLTSNVAGLTGGTSPNVTSVDDPVTQAVIQVNVPSGAGGEVYYIDAVQFEAGDVMTAYHPRADEIVANKVTANMINVAQLSAISANIGNVTAGTITGITITGTTITGALVQSSASTPRAWMDSTGFHLSEDTKRIGVGYQAPPNVESIDWVDNSGNLQEFINGMVLQDGSGTPLWHGLVIGAGGATLNLFLSDGSSDFLQLASTANRKVAFGTASVPFSANTISTAATVTHGLGAVPNFILITGRDTSGNIFWFESFNRTASTFDIYGRATANVTGNMGCDWMAIV